MTDRESLMRWRLVLGSDAEQGLGCGLDGVDAQRDRVLGYLYNREYKPGRNVRGTQPGAGGGHGGQGKAEDRKGGLDDSQLTVPEWINQAHELFPKRTCERLERDALERYGLTELVTNPEL